MQAWHLKREVAPSILAWAEEFVLTRNISKIILTVEARAFSTHRSSTGNTS